MSIGRAVQHRDQIHRDTTLDAMSVALLDTAAMQRLGRVYQLGYAHLVYRGGTHTRLAHALGAAHVAGGFVDTLRANYDGAAAPPRAAIAPSRFLPAPHVKNADKASVLDLRWQVLRHLARWAALLHDIGHIPLGHTLEDEFDRIFLKHDDFNSPRMPYIWYEEAPGRASEIYRVLTQDKYLPPCFEQLRIGGETVWKTVMCIVLHKEKYIFDGSSMLRRSFAGLIAPTTPTEPAARSATSPEYRTGNEPRPHSAVQRTFLEVVERAHRDVSGKTFFPYISDIVGNTICADYLDYLRRDAVNVGLDVVSDERVISSFYVAEIGESTSGIAGIASDPTRESAPQLRMALSLLDRRAKKRLETCTGVLDLVRRRFRFAEIIYYHKTKVAASAMFAKAFGLVDEVSEVRTLPQRTIELPRLEDVIKELSELPHDDFREFRDAHLPSALLDPEIGDETLNLFLQHRAWRQVQRAHDEGKLQDVRAPLRAIALLQAIGRRQLYKVFLTFDYPLFTRLWPIATADASATAASAEKLLDRLRDTRQKTRDEIERRVAQAVGWPDDSILLYVPPRKVQAKGIETYAFDAQGTVTLGSHSLVESKVRELNADYSALWRMIVLVHPKYMTDDRRLSDAADEIVRAVYGNDPSHLNREMTEACWFQYIPRQNRDAADQFRALMHGNGSSDLTGGDVDWSCFSDCLESVPPNYTIDSTEHANRAALLALARAQGLPEPIHKIRAEFPSPGSLSAEVRTASAAAGAQLKIQGTPEDSDVAERRAALEMILTRITATD